MPFCINVPVPNFYILISIFSGTFSIKLFNLSTLTESDSEPIRNIFIDLISERDD